MKDPKTCAHWSMAFCVLDPIILVRCMVCGTQASLRVDGVHKFTTTWARNALDKARDEQPQEVQP